MTGHTLVGRRVRISARDDLGAVLPFGPCGVLTRVAAIDGRVEVIVRVDGLVRGDTFALDEVEVLPPPNVL